MPTGWKPYKRQTYPAGAVTIYARESQQTRLDEAKERGNERVGFLIHELRNLVSTAIGLAFSRWGAEANGGRLYARNLPERGCVFTVDLPRCTGSGGARA